MTCRFRAATAALALALTTAQAVHAQARISAELDAGATFWTSYIDRGIMLANLPVLQPHLKVGIRAPKGGTVTLGALGTVELSSPRTPDQFGMAGSLKRPNVVEARPSLTLAQPFAKGNVVVDVGGYYRLFPNDSGFTSEANTGAVVTGLSFPKSPLPLRIGFSYETGAIEGASLEAEVKRALVLAPGAAVTLGARSGYAIRQKVTAGPAVLQQFARDGITHLTLSGGFDVTIVGAHVRPVLEATYVRDSTSTSPLPYNQRPWQWLVRFGTTISVGGIFPKPVPPPPAPKAAPAKPAARKP